MEDQKQSIEWQYPENTIQGLREYVRVNPDKKSISKILINSNSYGWNAIFFMFAEVCKFIIGSVSYFIAINTYKIKRLDQIFYPFVNTAILWQNYTINEQQTRKLVKAKKVIDEYEETYSEIKHQNNAPVEELYTFQINSDDIRDSNGKIDESKIQALLIEAHNKVCPNPKHRSNTPSVKSEIKPFRKET